MNAQATTTTLDPAHVVLERLEGVRQTGPGRFAARCPSHDDRAPSLSIRITPSHVLVLCRAGCRTDDVLHALGLEWRALFRDDRPPSPRRPRPRETERQRAFREVLERERRNAARRAPWVPHYLMADFSRHCSRKARDARALATRMGEADARSWPLLERAATIERAGFLVEAGLDMQLAERRWR